MPAARDAAAGVEEMEYLLHIALLALAGVFCAWLLRPDKRAELPRLTRFDFDQAKAREELGGGGV